MEGVAVQRAKRDQILTHPRRIAKATSVALLLNRFRDGEIRRDEHPRRSRASSNCASSVRSHTRTSSVLLSTEAVKGSAASRDISRYNRLRA